MVDTVQTKSRIQTWPPGLLPPRSNVIPCPDLAPESMIPAGVEAILSDATGLAPHQRAQLRTHIAMLHRSVHEMGRINRDVMVMRSELRRELASAKTERDSIARRFAAMAGAPRLRVAR